LEVLPGLHEGDLLHAEIVDERVEVSLQNRRQAKISTGGIQLVLHNYVR
jgi:hypothetical protein